MIKNQNIEKLLMILSNEIDYVTAKYLAEKIEISEKSVYRFIKLINQQYPEDDPLIISEKGRGFLLVKHNRSVDSLIYQLMETTPEGRQARELEKLLRSAPQPIAIYQLSQAFFVSESVILKDRQELQKKLNPYGLNLILRKGMLSINGSEVSIRKAIIDLNPTFQTLDLDNLFKDNDNAVNFEIAQFVQREISLLEERIGGRLPYPYDINLFSHIYIMIDRVTKRKRSLDFQMTIKRVAYDNPLMLESRRVIHHIENYIGQKIEAEEVLYLYHYLISSRFQHSSREVEDEVMTFPPRVTEITSAYFSNMNGTVNYSVDIQSPMFKDLANHVSPLLNRLENNICIKNSLLKEIEMNYNDIFLELEKVSQKISLDYQLPAISKDEIGFLTLYFARFRETTKKTVNTVIMCTTGIGTSELLKFKIENSINGITILDVIAYSDIVSIFRTYPNMDLLITTVDVDVPEKVAKIIVSAFFKEGDRRRLQRKIEAIQYGKEMD
ncbi:BglG family transcription antiterminator [Streptococcus merionis]|uniref:Transcriptional antiterminator n=1 Tax=Streptococcus merionis TaxID=400065 RepID=A0A239SVE9_9STRE|nr:PRD domain-containing protein [Streptococcus merionis]SNU89316.1 transcriptional antiterminator [Streptococcus merionis]